MRHAVVMALMTLLVLQHPVDAAQQNVQPSPEMAAFVRGLAPGTPVKLTLTSGTKVTGLLISVGDEEVAVRRRTRIPEPLRRVPIGEIADADIVPERSAGKTIAAAAAVGAGAALGFLFLLAALYGGD